jgi:hypothetical protein
MTTHEVHVMNQQTETVRMRHDELDREIESICAERLINASGPTRPSVATRARAGLGRRLIALGNALVGRAEAVSAANSNRVRA